MKKLLAMLVLITLPLLGNTTDYQEGKHYVAVKAIEANNAEVREYFSFYCGHCFRYEPLMHSVKKHLPEGAVFVKNHVDFLPGTSHKMQKMMTKALVAAQVLNVEESQIAAIFKFIHVHKAVFTSLKDVRNVFVLNGVDGEEFDQAFASEQVKLKAKVMHEHQDALAKSGGITGVPAIIINGKYRVIATDLDKENFEQDYNNLIKYLLNLG